MADASLDDFFAKKDKSKKSKSRKFTSNDSAGKVDDGGSSKSEKPKREKEKAANSTAGSTLSQNPTKDDDDWKDVEEKKTDYSGLKIQNVQISDLRDDDNERARSDETQDDENSKNKDGIGPWKVVEPVLAPPPEPVVVAEPAPAPKNNKYVAPAMRDQGASNSTPLPKAKSKAAPQLASESDFPSLSAATDAKPAKKLDQSNLRRPYSEMTNPANSS